MARRNKLEKFAEILSFANVYENYDPKEPKLVKEGFEEVDLKGMWGKAHFQNDQPIVLELACGRGEYTLGLAKLHPDINYIGVEIKGARIWKGARIALEENLQNVAFLRTRIEQIELFFGSGEIAEIWITFPDPFLRDSKENRRLSSPNFLKRYQKILQTDAIIHLKTDSEELYSYTKEVIENENDWSLIHDNPDIYSKGLEFEELAIQTYYEKMHLDKGKKITYLQFQNKKSTSFYLMKCFLNSFSIYHASPSPTKFLSTNTLPQCSQAMIFLLAEISI